MISVEELKKSKERAKLKYEADLKRFYSEKDDKIVSFLKGVPDIYRKTWLSILMGKNSKKSAIKLKCLDCCTYDRIEVKNCEIKTCALYYIR